MLPAVRGCIVCYTQTCRWHTGYCESPGSRWITCLPFNSGPSQAYHRYTAQILGVNSRENCITSAQKPAHFPSPAKPNEAARCHRIVSGEKISKINYSQSLHSFSKYGLLTAHSHWCYAFYCKLRAVNIFPTLIVGRKKREHAVCPCPVDAIPRVTNT